MKKKCTGSGIIPIIKSLDNKYYLVLFKSIIRKKYLTNSIEDAGGEYEGGNIKISAIRELKEESCLLFNLENMQNKNSILYLNKILSKFNIVNENFNNEYYVSHFVYLENKTTECFNLETLRNEYMNNLKNFWKDGFSVYTENKDIIFIPLDTLFNKNNIEHVKDYLGKEYILFERTYSIFKNLKNDYNEKDFFNELIKNPIILEKKDINNYKYYKGNANNIITYE
jgi:hypothetical protein